MPLTVIVSFVVVFALMLLAVSMGLKYFDARRKKQVVDMLQTASGEPVVTVGNLLKEIETDKPAGIKRLLASLQFSRHAAEMIQQAGRFGFQVYYGDGTRLDVLRAARADDARIVAICIDNRENASRIVDMVQKMPGSDRI